jgi:ATPase subunit of ABC transporter with duplicated ATPase domains
VLIVSHDRRFLDNVAATRTIELAHGRLVDRH